VTSQPYGRAPNLRDFSNAWSGLRRSGRGAAGLRRSS